jgi:pyruvate dehydrogenase E1 component alpha subunit
MTLMSSIYESALRIRRVEEAISQKYTEGKMRCPVHLSIGQEIPSAVFGEFKIVEDKVVSTHRSHGHYLAAGGSLKKMIAEIYGKITGCSMGRGGSMHLFDQEMGFMGSSAIVGNSIPVGVGLALAQKLQNSNGITFIFLGEGATEEGVYYEALNFSALHSLPALFVCENNLYSVYTGLDYRQPKGREISKIATSMGVTSYKASDRQINELVSIFGKCVQEVRQGSGPRLIEINTYRFLEHCGPNDDDELLEYRPVDERNFYKDSDPLVILKNLIAKSNPSYLDNLKKIELVLKQELDQAFEFAENSEFPKIQYVLRSH